MTTNTRNRQPEGIPTGGQFAATTHTEPSFSLTALEPEASPTTPRRQYKLKEDSGDTFTFDEAGTQTTLEYKTPATRSEVRRALHCPRGKGLVVDLHAVTGRRSSDRDDTYPVNGPESGAPLVIRIQGGYHRLQVQSGNVHVEVLGGFAATPGCTIVEDRATASVIVDGATGYMVETRGDANASVALSSKSKVRLRAAGTSTMRVTGGGPGCEIAATDGAAILQDEPEEGRLQLALAAQNPDEPHTRKS